MISIVEYISNNLTTNKSDTNTTQQEYNNILKKNMLLHHTPLKTVKIQHPKRADLSKDAISDVDGVIKNAKINAGQEIFTKHVS